MENRRKIAGNGRFVNHNRRTVPRAGSAQHHQPGQQLAQFGRKLRPQ